MSKRGNEGIPGNSLKFEKSITRMSQRGSYAKMRSHERLSGGADSKSKSSVSLNKSAADANPKVTPVASANSRLAMEDAEEIESLPVESSAHVEEKMPGDKKVNEMIEDVIRNLQEAGKALASLGENFEHDLKLMFVDVMGKVQNWVSLAQIRLDAAKNDFDSLRRELITRSNEVVSREREITNLRKKLTESEVTKVAYEKALAENIQRSSGPIASPSNTTFVPSRQPLPTAPPSGHLVNMAQDSGDLSGAQSGAQFGAQSSAQSGAQFGAQSSAQFGAQSSAQSGAQFGAQSSAQSGAQFGAQSSAQSGAQFGIPSQGAPAHDGISGAHGDPTSGAGALKSYGPHGPTQNGYGQSHQTSGIPGGGPTDRTSTADAAVQSGKSKEKAKRSSDLESELSRLRRENERILKERTDYENAIQRALLRGVSSLNAETLRVLKCPPIGCYTPCGPPPSPVNTVETMIPCTAKKTRDNWTPRTCRTTTNATQSRQGSIQVRSNVATLPEQESSCCSTKKPSTGTYGTCTRNKKSPVTSDPSMVFLHHQFEGSSVCVSGNTTQIRPCRRTKSKKLESSVCVKKLG